MARRFDAHKELVDEYRLVKQKCVELGREYRAVEAMEKKLRNEIAHLMQNSTVAEIEGTTVFELSQGSRSTVTIGRVMKFAPELADVLIETSTWPKINFI